MHLIILFSLLSINFYFSLISSSMLVCGYWRLQVFNTKIISLIFIRIGSYWISWVVKFPTKIYKIKKLIYPFDLLKPNTKTQNIFCCVNENLTTFYTLWQGGQKNKRRKKVFSLKCIKSRMLLKQNLGFSI